MKTASVAELKNNLSEYLANVRFSGEHVLITKRDKPIAALVSIDQLDQLKTRDEMRGLASVIGKWKGFEEIAGDIEKAWASRGKDEGRKVSL